MATIEYYTVHRNGAMHANLHRRKLSVSVMNIPQAAPQTGCLVKLAGPHRKHARGGGQSIWHPQI